MLHSSDRSVRKHEEKTRTKICSCEAHYAVAPPPKIRSIKRNTSAVWIVQGYLSRSRLLDSVKTPSVYSSSGANALHSTSYSLGPQFCNSSSNLSRRDRLPLLPRLVGDCGRVRHFFVDFVGDGAVDSLVLLARHLTGLGLPVRLQRGPHDSGDIFLHLEWQGFPRR